MNKTLLEMLSPNTTALVNKYAAAPADSAAALEALETMATELLKEWTGRNLMGLDNGNLITALYEVAKKVDEVAVKVPMRAAVQEVAFDVLAVTIIAGGIDLSNGWTGAISTGKYRAHGLDSRLNARAEALETTKAEMADAALSETIGAPGVVDRNEVASTASSNYYWMFHRCWHAADMLSGIQRALRVRVSHMA